MADLLLEVYQEELPPIEQYRLQRMLSTKVQGVLDKVGCSCLNQDIWVTLRRIGFNLQGLTKKSPSGLVSGSGLVRGPRVGVDKLALSGFLKKYALQDESDLKIIEIEGIAYYHYDRSLKDISWEKLAHEIANALMGAIASCFSSLVLWGNEATKWSRPIKNILLLLDGQLVDFEYYGIKATNLAYAGLNPVEEVPVVVGGIDSYRKLMEGSGIILDYSKRVDLLCEVLQAEADSLQADIIALEQHVSKIACLVERIVPLKGEFDGIYKVLPKEVINLTLSQNQHYIVLLEKNSQEVMNQYLLVTDIIIPSGDYARVINGSNAVVQARLEDALFFYNKDCEVDLLDNLPKLKNILFHEKLKSFYEKTERLSALASFISLWIPKANLINIDKAAKIAKADLVSQMVREFPELQGVMGFYYAKFQGFSDEIAEAVKEHYLPISKNSALPQSSVSIALSLADKIDNIIGMFLIGEIPTSSKDPYALRRNALGIVRIILEYNIALPLALVFDKAIKLFVAENKSLVTSSKNVRKDAQEFLRTRFSVYLADIGVSAEIIKVAMKSFADDIGKTALKIKVFDLFWKQGVIPKQLAIYHRINNILLSSDYKESKRGIKKEKIKEKDLELEIDQEVTKMLADTKKKVNDLLKEHNIIDAMLAVQPLCDLLEIYFARVQINSDEDSLKKARVVLLKQVMNLMDSVFDFRDLVN